MITDKGKFTILFNIDYGALNSTNVWKEQQHIVERKERELAIINEKRAAEYMRQELKIKSEKIKKKLFDNLKVKTRKRKKLTMT